MVTPARILVVEDEVIVAEGIRATLEEFGYEVTEIAITSEEALQAVATYEPDLVLMDIKLKGLVDGISTAEQIREQFFIPVIYLTAFADDEMLDRARVTEPFGYIVKPFDARDLNVTIEMALYKHQMQEKLRVSERHYRTLFERVPVGLYKVTEDGHILDANPALVEMLGYPDLETLCAANALDLYADPETRQQWLEIVQAEEVVRNFEVRLRRYDQRVIWVLDNVRSVQDADGATYYEGSLEDITERKWAEDALRQRNRELDLLHHAGQRFGSTLDLQQVLKNIMDEVRQLLHASSASIWLFDRDTNELVYPLSADSESSEVRLSPKVGVAGWVARQARSLIVPDVLESEQFVVERDEAVEGLMVRSILSVPLQVKDRVTGVIQLLSTEPKHFGYAELALVEALAASAAIAIENARLYEDVDRLFNLTQVALDQTESLYHVSRAMSNLSELSDLLHSVADGVAEVLPADIVLLARFDPTTDALTQVVGGGAAYERLAEVSSATLWEGVVGAAIREAQSLLVTSREPCPSETDAARQQRMEWDIGSVAVVPLVYQETVLGSLTAMKDVEQEDFTQQDVGLLGAMANHVSMAMENVRLLNSLRESEMRFRWLASIVTSSDDAIIGKDLGGVILSWNAGAEHMYGYTAEEAVGQSIAMLMPPDLADEEQKILDRVQQGGHFEHYETRRVRKDGTSLQVSLVISPVKDEEGQIIGASTIARDITERKEAEAMLNQRLGQLESLNQASQAITASLELDEVLREIMSLAKQVIGADYARIVLAEQAPDHAQGKGFYRTVQLTPDAQALEGHIRAQGFTAWIMDAEQAVVLDDVADDGIVLSPVPEGAPSKANPLDVAAGIHSIAGFPLIFEDTLLGVLYFYGQQRALFHGQASFLTTFANQSAVAIAHARLHAELKRQTHELTILLEAARDFSSTLNFDELMMRVAEHLAKVIKVSHATFFRWLPEPQTFTVWRNWCGLAQTCDGLLLDTIYAVAQLPAFQGVVESRRPSILHIGDSNITEAETKILQAADAGSALLLPLAVGERVSGVIQLLEHQESRGFSFAEISMGQALARQAAVAIENAQLYEAVRQQRQQLRALAARLTEAEESERQWLAQELHDQVGQNLTALGINLDIIRSLLPESPDEALLSRLEDTSKLLSQVTERIRGVMADLRPPVLEDYGLVAALRWYGALFNERTGIAVEVTGEEPDPRLVVSAENALFRITQEALTNVAKHAQAEQVWISVELDPKMLQLVITDDGVGFDPARLEESGRRRGWGLVSMTERAETVGGVCRIEPEPDGGTRVVVEVQR